MSARDYIRWMPAFFAVVSLVMVQFVHFAVSDPAHADEMVGHTHEASKSHGESHAGSHEDPPADGHADTTHCVSHGACHLLLHALGSMAPSGLAWHVSDASNLVPLAGRIDGRSVAPPTPPPLS